MGKMRRVNYKPTKSSSIGKTISKKNKIRSSDRGSLIKEVTVVVFLVKCTKSKPIGWKNSVRKHAMGASGALGRTGLLTRDTFSQHLPKGSTAENQKMIRRKHPEPILGSKKTVILDERQRKSLSSGS